MKRLRKGGSGAGNGRLEISGEQQLVAWMT
jgi:hypothetical protein